MKIVKLGSLIKEYSIKYKNTADDIPVYSVTNSSGFKKSTDYFNKEVFSADLSSYKLVYKNSFAYNPSRINVGSISYQGIEDGVLVSPLYNVFSINEKITPRYLNYFFKSNYSKNYIKNHTSGSVRSNFRIKDMSDMDIILPSLEEQERFVDELNDIEYNIALLTKQVNNYDEIVKSQFIEMFGDHKTNSLMLKTETLGETCEFYSGTGFPNDYQGNTEGTYPFYKVGDISRNVQSGNTRLVDCENYINDDVLKLIKGSIIPEGTVVFAKIGEALRLNRRAITVCDCLIDNNAMGIRPGAKLTLEYFFQYMRLLDMGEYAGATAIPSVRKSTLEEVQILVPDIYEQRRFSEMFKQIDKSKYFGGVMYA